MRPGKTRIQEGDTGMMNKKSDDNREVKQLSDEEIKAVNGGMKVAVEDDSSWFRKIADFFFSVKQD